MLRSLVGSEMCIRDRNNDDSASPTGIGLGATTLSRSPGNLYRTDGSGNYCLLYTSDAADDLLCVDLGGRRIIKKKNTQRVVNMSLRINRYAFTIITTRIKR